MLESVIGRYVSREMFQERADSGRDLRAFSSEVGPGLRPKMRAHHSVVSKSSRLEHDPEKPAPDLIRVGTGFRKKIMLQQQARAGCRFEEKSSCSSAACETTPPQYRYCFLAFALVVGAAGGGGGGRLGGAFGGPRT